MTKKLLKGSTPLAPIPSALITCASPDGKANIITLAWVGVACSQPPMVTIAVRPNRHSHAMIKDSGEFVVNIPRAEMVAAADYCGVKSGRDVDKFSETGLTPLPAAKVKAPLIAECPVSLECVVRQTLELGSHDLFIGEVLAVQADEAVLNDERIDPAKYGPLAFVNGSYWSLGEPLGPQGLSNRK